MSRWANQNPWERFQPGRFHPWPSSARVPKGTFRSMAPGSPGDLESRAQELQGPSGAVVASEGQPVVDQVRGLLRVAPEGAEKRGVVGHLDIPGEQGRSGDELD